MSSLQYVPYYASNGFAFHLFLVPVEPLNPGPVFTDPFLRRFQVFFIRLFYIKKRLNVTQLQKLCYIQIHKICRKRRKNALENTLRIRAPVYPTAIHYSPCRDSLFQEVEATSQPLLGQHARQLSILPTSEDIFDIHKHYIHTTLLASLSA